MSLKGFQSQSNSTSWPVTLASQDLCHYPFPIDITATPSPNDSSTPTAVLDGTTITSDENCYLSYAPLTAWGLIGNSSASYTLPAGILSVPSSELQSYRADFAGIETADIFSFNFADLLPNHVPILAYEGQAQCVLDQVNSLNNPFCATIFESLYAPQLIYPSQFKDLDPRFSTCTFDYYGLYDPPTSLVPVGWLTTPTAYAGGDPPITSEPAVPRPTGHLLLPPPTTVPFSQMSATTDRPGDAAPSTSNGAVTSTIALGPAPAAIPAQVTPPAPSAVFHFGGEVVTASPDPAGGGLLINGTQLADGAVATVDGVELSAALGGTAVVLVSKGATQVVPLTAGPQVAVVTLPGGGALTATSAAGGAVLVLGVALSAGGPPLTTNGVVLSAALGGLVVSADPDGGPGFVEGAVFTVGSVASTVYESVDANGSTVVVIIGAQTLTVGGSPVTLSDEEVSAGASALLVVGGGRTGSFGFSAIPAATTATTATTTSAVGGDALQETESFMVTSATTSIARTTAPEASSTHKKSNGHRIHTSWSNTVLGVLVCLLVAL